MGKHKTSNAGETGDGRKEPTGYEINERTAIPYSPREITHSLAHPRRQYTGTLIAGDNPINQFRSRKKQTVPERRTCGSRQKKRKRRERVSECKRDTTDAGEENSATTTHDRTSMANETSRSGLG